MYDVDHEAMKHPENGIAADVTNTEEYGWVVAAGSSIFADEELVAFAAADISKAKVTLAQTSYTHDGKAKEPAVTVTLGGKTLAVGPIEPR